jgi:hypothetical protein
MLLKDAVGPAGGKKPAVNLIPHSQNLESPITQINQTYTEEIDDIIHYQHDKNTTQLSEISSVLITPK